MKKELTPTTTKKIENEVREAFERDGQATAFDVANKYPNVIYERCEGCDTESPTIRGKHECLICGSETKLIPVSTTKGELLHVSTYGRYPEIRGILDRKRNGIDCEEHESAAIKTWVKHEILAIGNGSIELDEEIQELLPIEWGEAQDELGNIDERGNLKEMGLIKIFSPTQESKGELLQDEDIKICEDAIYRAYDYLFALGYFTTPTNEGRIVENLLIQGRVRILVVKDERQKLLDSNRELLDALLKAKTDIYNIANGINGKRYVIDMIGDIDKVTNNNVKK